LGLTAVRFADYLVASIGMLPGTLLYVYYGKVAGDVARLAGGTAVRRGPARAAGGDRWRRRRPLIRSRACRRTAPASSPSITSTGSSSPTSTRTDGSIRSPGPGIIS